MKSIFTSAFHRSKMVLQHFWKNGRLVLLFILLAAFIGISFATKFIDVESWIASENHTVTNNFVANPSPEQIKLFINNPVRAIKIRQNTQPGSLILSFDKSLENATVQVYDRNAKLIFLSEDQDGRALELDVSEFSKGSYLINVADDHFNYYSSKYTKK